MKLLAPAGTTIPVEARAPAWRPVRAIGRPDGLTAQRIEVGIVLNAMLGATAAADYFAMHEVDARVVARVLDPQGRRRGSHDVHGVRNDARA